MTGKADDQSSFSMRCSGSERNGEAQRRCSPCREVTQVTLAHSSHLTSTPLIPSSDSHHASQEVCRYLPSQHQSCTPHEPHATRWCWCLAQVHQPSRRPAWRFAGSSYPTHSRTHRQEEDHLFPFGSYASSCTARDVAGHERFASLACVGSQPASSEGGCMLTYSAATVANKAGMRRKSSDLPSAPVYRTPNKWKLPAISDVGSDAEDDDDMLGADTSPT